MMEEVEISPSSVFEGHGCATHGVGEWRGSHCTRYHAYLNPENHALPDSIDFAYGDSIHIESRADELFGKKFGGNEEADENLENSESERSEANGKEN